MSKRIWFVVVAVLLAVAGFGIRTASGRSAHSQATKIVSADTAGTDTKAAIADLKTFAQNHMGASVSFTLQGSYDRANAAAQAAAAASTSTSQVYADAQKACASKSDSLVQAHCNQAYLAAHLPAATAPATVLAPKLSDYQYKIKAPLWSPDLAGALLLGAVVALGFGLVAGRRRKGHF
ncbi:MAG TPA: hypothetical protein VHQ86_04730 [Candidatus Saccharimonadia bacterium]|nr:hypothetical protein [Candidatus Saccharimonadia bacterium]